MRWNEGFPRTRDGFQYEGDGESSSKKGSNPSGIDKNGSNEVATGVTWNLDSERNKLHSHETGRSVVQYRDMSARI